MKKLIAVLIAFAMASGAGYAVAQEKKTEEKKAEKAEKAGEKKSDDTKKMRAKNASGTVKSATADSIVVAGKAKGKEAEWTFAVDAKTSIKKEGKAVTAADLKAGDPVQVRFMEHDGKAVAQSVTVKGAAKKAEKKAEKAEEKKATTAEKTEKK